MIIYRRIGNILLTIGICAVFAGTVLGYIGKDSFGMEGLFLFGFGILSGLVSLVLQRLHGIRVNMGPVVWGKIINAWNESEKSVKIIKLEVTYITNAKEKITALDWVYVSQIKMSDFGRGRIVPLKYDPKHPSHIKVFSDVEKARAKYGSPSQQVVNDLENQNPWEQTEFSTFDSFDDIKSKMSDFSKFGTISNGKTQFSFGKSTFNTKTTQYSTTERSTADVTGRVQAQGVILSIQPTGNIINDEGEMMLYLQITRPDGTSYNTTITKPVPQVRLFFLTKGSVVTVFYMPYDEQNIVLV
ncbi:hypothetical protein [Flavobacterium chilense]|uniref:Uncharacterized protein n=1 Tax=Flavobacterium chilense TaxID=946677 RepID=A0A1M7F545_9FLAO|nr:hypothetical protein [Flavobacterium chilense]SHL99182.1 hypothetical protein SAMN05444484_103230 [Flavobacterium chilense]